MATATTTTCTVANILRRAVISLVLLVLSLPVLQCIVGALPLHWLGYEPLPRAGPNTVYVPGAWLCVCVVLYACLMMTHNLVGVSACRMQ